MSITTQAPPEFTHSQNPRAWEEVPPDPGAYVPQGPRRAGPQARAGAPTRARESPQGAGGGPWEGGPDVGAEPTPTAWKRPREQA